MARNRNRNRRPQQVSSPNAVVPQEPENQVSDIEENEDDVTDETQTPAEENKTLEQTETIGDTVTGSEVKVTPETPEDEVETSEPQTTEPIAVADAISEPASEEVPVEEPTSNNDAPNVAKLKEILKLLKEALEGPGKNPEDFAHAAKLTTVLTRHITNNARPEVLDTLLAFYEENKDGVCGATEFMKGSTTLSATDEHQVGFLHNLFLQLANKRFFRVNDAQVVNILKRPEIATYFKRRVAGYKANA